MTFPDFTRHFFFSLDKNHRHILENITIFVDILARHSLFDLRGKVLLIFHIAGSLTQIGLRLLCTNKLSFCHLFHRFSVTMEPHCSFKASKNLLKNINCHHHNANDRFGFNILTISLVVSDKCYIFATSKREDQMWQGIFTVGQFTDLKCK